ncbi:MAG TPA: hypothetical protein VD865_13680 [Stenotrophomonas sp.]|nr:hypothetical protein [Stenotrophomonas sp.]
MIHADGWSSAQEPRFVAGLFGAPQRVAAHIKREEARALATAVEAHRAAGGLYIVLDGTPTPPAPRRQYGE